MLPVAWFERKGALRLGAIRGGGETKATLIDQGGELVRLRRSRLLGTHAAEVPRGDPRIVAKALRALRRAMEPMPDDQVDRLYDAMEDGRGYTLPQLAALLGRPDEAPLAEALCPKGERMHLGFRLRRGRIERVDPQTRARLEERAARQAREAAEHAGLIDWLRRPDRPPTPPAEAVGWLERLQAYALEGERAAEVGGIKRLVRQLDRETPDEVLAYLEQEGLLPRDVNELPTRRGIPTRFPADAAAQSDVLLGAPPSVDGEDLTAHPAFAIDAPGTFEVDDTIAAWEEGGALHFAIHVCRLDVIAADSPLDREARRRATSVYFPDETIPMFPRALGERLLGLQPGADRRAVSLVCRVGPEGLPEASWFVRSRVRVARCVDYAEAEATGLDGTIERLLPVARALQRARLARGACLVQLPQVKVTRDEAGRFTPTHLNRETDAHVVVSELMILFNARLGDELAAAGYPALYRTQPQPPPHDDAARLDPASPLYPLRARRLLRPTVVTARPGPQRSMGLDCYVQGTSPLRRMGDLVVQRQLLALLDGRPPAYGEEELLELQQELALGSRRARQAEDARHRYFKLRWLESQPTVDGFISQRRPMVYVPALDREFPCARDDTLPPVGEPVRARVRRLSPRVGTVELAQVGDDYPAGGDSTA